MFDSGEIDSLLSASARLAPATNRTPTKIGDRSHLREPGPQLDIVGSERRTARARRAGLATRRMRSQILKEAGEVQKPSSTLASLIDELRVEMRRSPRRAHLHELARHRIDAPHEVIDWAKRDRRWSYTLAEIM